MKKNASSSRIQSLIFITGLLLLQLSCHNLLFAAQASTGRLPIFKNTIPIKITHGSVIFITAEGDDRIESANGSIID